MKYVNAAYAVFLALTIPGFIWHVSRFFLGFEIFGHKMTGFVGFLAWFGAIIIAPISIVNGWGAILGFW